MTAPPVARLDSVAEVRLGRQRSPKDHRGPNMRPYVRAANVGWDGLLLHDVKTMNFTDDEMLVYGLRPGDLLLNEASGSPHEVGKPALWRGELEECAFQNTLLRVRPTRANPNYLLHYFRMQAATGAFAKKSRGVGIHHLGREALAAWLIPLPSFDDQRRIAAVLDKADEIRSRRQESAEGLRVLDDDLFIHTFGDSVSNPNDWPANVTLGDIASVISGITKGRRTAATVRSVPYLAVANVQAGHVRLDSVKVIDATEEEISRYRLLVGDLVLTEGGDPDKLGRGSIWNGEIAECIHQNHIFRVRVTDPHFDPVFVHHLLGSERGRRYFLRSAKQTTGIASINKSQLSSFPMLRPPLSLQAKFAEQVAAYRTLMEQVSRHSQQLDSLCACLQHRAFAGDL